MHKAITGLALVAALGIGAAACGGTTKTVTVPGPTITRDVPGPIRYQLPPGCGAALAAFEKAENTLRASETLAWQHAANNALDQTDVDARSANSAAADAADKAAADTCFPSTNG